MNKWKMKSILKRCNTPSNTSVASLMHFVLTTVQYQDLAIKGIEKLNYSSLRRSPRKLSSSSLPPVSYRLVADHTPPPAADDDDGVTVRGVEVSRHRCEQTFLFW